MKQTPLWIVNQSIDALVDRGVSPPPHSVRAFVELQKLEPDKVARDKVVTELMKESNGDILPIVKATRKIIKSKFRKNQQTLGLVGTKELLFRLGVVLNEIWEGRE